MIINPLSSKHIQALERILNDELAIEKIQSNFRISETGNFSALKTIMQEFVSKASHDKTNLMNLPSVKLSQVINLINRSSALNPFENDYTIGLEIGGTEGVIEYRHYETLEPIEIAHFDEQTNNVFLHVGVLANYQEFYKVLIREMGYEGFFNFVLMHEMGHAVSYGLIRTEGNFFSSTVPTSSMIYDLIRPWDTELLDNEYKSIICESYADLYAAWCIKHLYPKQSHEIIQALSIVREDTNFYGYKTSKNLNDFLHKMDNITTFEEFNELTTQTIIKNIYLLIQNDMTHHLGHLLAQMNTWNFPNPLDIKNNLEYITELASQLNVQLSIEPPDNLSKLHHTSRETLLEQIDNGIKDEVFYLNQLEWLSEFEKIASLHNAVNPFKI